MNVAWVNTSNYTYDPLYIAQFTQDQHMQAMKLLETVQALERRKQQLEFQLQQIALSIQQAQAAQAMEEQFKAALKLKQQQSQGAPESKTRQTVKLALRKR